MSGYLRKMWVNLSPAYIGTLGLFTYCRMLVQFVFHLPQIFKGRDFRPLDRAMGGRVLPIHFQGRRFVVDCPACDQLVQDGSYTFGIIRELYLRNCYIRLGVAPVLRDAEYVLDLGANRGVFTVMAAAGAKCVVAVEVLPEVAKAIEANVKANGFDHVHIETAYVGNQVQAHRYPTEFVTVQDLMQRYDMPRLDVVKIDIEGSEFGLFEDADWLGHCRAICMEVHPGSGDPQVIMDTLADNGFTVDIGNTAFDAIADMQQAAFIWAWKA